MSYAPHPLLVLLRWRLTLLWRGATGRGATGRASRAPLLRWVILGAFMVFIAVALSRLLGGVAAGPLGRLLFEPILVWASSAVSLLLFLFAVPAVLATFTYRSDLRLLLLTPLSPRLILSEKFLVLYGGLTLPLLVVGTPILIGLGSAVGMGLAYDVFAVLILLLLPVAPLGLAMLLTVLILRWVPPVWGRNVAAFMGAAVSIAYYIGFQVLARNGATRPGQLRSTFAQVPHAWWSSLPAAWPGQALAAVGLGDSAAFGRYVVAAIVVAAVLAVAAVALSSYLFTTGWATYQEVGRRRRAATPVAAPSASVRGAMSRDATALDAVVVAGASAAVSAAYPGAALAARRGPPRVAWWPLVGKEWRTLRRDPRQWARLLYPLVILVFSFYRSVAQPETFGGGGQGGAASLFSAGWLFGTLSLLCYILAAALALPIVNREGKALYLLALAPLSARDVVLAKWTFSVLPPATLSVVVVIVAAVVLHLAVWQAVLGACAMVALCVELAGAALLISLTWPRLDWDNPARQNSTTAGLGGALAGLLLAAATCVLLILTFAWASSQPVAAVAAGIGIFVLAGTIIAVAAALAPARLEALLNGG